MISTPMAYLPAGIPRSRSGLVSVSRQSLGFAAIVVALACSATVGRATGQGLEARSPAVQDGSAAASSEIQVGIAGKFRLGAWTAVRLEPPRRIAAIETTDGDGVRVRYHQAETPADSRWGYAVGNPAGPLRLYGDDDELLARARFVDGLAAALPWIVVIGDPLGVDEIGKSDLLRREATVAVSQVSSADQLPDRIAGWDGVDLLVINPAGLNVIGELDDSQVAAIVRWVHQGGRLFLSLGGRGGELLAADWLAELANIPAGESPIRIDPAALETYTSSQTPLPTLDGYPLPARGGRTVISGRTAARQPARLAFERLAGLGRVLVTSFALDSPEFAQWPERTTLIARMHPGVLETAERRRDARAIHAVGYDDLAGQVRASLDRFDSLRRMPFSIVAVLVLVLAGLVGPLDYLLVNRLIGRPLLGWVSFPLSVIALVAVIVVLQGREEPAVAGPAGSAEARRTDAALRSNRIEIVDINALGAEPIGRATALTHVASPDAVRFDFDVRFAGELFAAADEGDDRDAGALSGPYGFGGTTFGGIAIEGEDRRLPAYEIRLGVPPGPQGAAELFARPEAVPLAPAGSKGFISRRQFRPQLGETTGLRRRRGSELLTGSITNPLPVDLLDGVLVYGNWAYLMPGRLRAGTRIDSLETLRQKNFRWHLTRREALENTMRQEVWNPQMTDDFGRLTEVLMFASAVGGRDYTGLSNRPLGDLDLSHVPAFGHAVLVGRLPEPAFPMPLEQEKPIVSAVRIVLSVAPPTLDTR